MVWLVKPVPGASGLILTVQSIISKSAIMFSLVTIPAKAAGPVFTSGRPILHKPQTWYFLLDWTTLTIFAIRCF